MKTSEVLDALQRKWADGEYLKIREAPVDSARQKRKLDLLVVSLWRSRGLELDGVEIKVSMSDFRKELNEPAKADWWWAHVQRFWIAAPEKLADQVKAELPATWGLLLVSGNRVKIGKQAPNHEAEALPWSTCVGLLRATADCGLAVQKRVRVQARAQGYDAGREDALRHGGDKRLRDQLARLRQKISAFEEASGIEIGSFRSISRAHDLGKIVRMVEETVGNPEWTTRDLERVVVGLRRQTAKIAELATQLREAMATKEKETP